MRVSYLYINQSGTNITYFKFIQMSHISNSFTYKLQALHAGANDKFYILFFFKFCFIIVGVVFLYLSIKFKFT